MVTNVDKQTGRVFKAVEPIRPAMQPPEGEAAQAWTQFCDRLKSAGHLLLSQPKTEDAVLQAESLRFLTRELRAGLEWETEIALSTLPRFCIKDLSGSGPPGPNLDNEYWAARVHPGKRYKLTIDTRMIDDIIIGVNNRDYRNDGDFSFKDFVIDADGMLRITLSPDEQPNNWIRTLEDAYRCSIRVYYHDWSRQHRPDIWIDLLDEVADDSAGSDIATWSQALQDTVDYLESWPYKYPVFQTLYADQVAPNIMRPPLGIPGGGAEIQYGLSRVELQDDEALLIESEVPDAPYWGFHVYTMPWFSQIDPAARITALNDRQSHVSSDGNVRYVVSRNDPGIQNWLDTAGLPTLSVFYRWIWSNNSPTPTARVVKLSDVRSHLPADTPQFDAEQRKAQIRARRHHLQNRFRA